MKKKILLTTIFVFILMVACYTVSNAATYETDTFKVNIPDKYKVEKKENMIFIDDQKINSNGSAVMAAGIQSSRLDGIIPDDDVLDIVVEDYKENAGNNFNLIDAALVEINNCRGVGMVYRNTTPGGRYYYGVYYALFSDNYVYDVEFRSTSSNYLTSVELTSITKSFKVKNTVKNTNGIPFTDVGRNDWYYSSVKYVSDNKIVSGVNDYTYNPSGKLTRGQLATILWRMEGMPKVNNGKNFPDVKSSDYYYNAVKWASANKIVNGFNDGTFGANKNITREQLAVMLQNYARYKKANTTKVADISKYKDVKGISDYAKNAVAWAIQNKIISGKENGTRIDPKGNASRAELAAMIQNYRTYVK